MPIFAGGTSSPSFEVGGHQRVSVRSRGRGLLALYLFTDLGADDVPTRLRPGSHLDVPPVLVPGGDDGLEWSRAAAAAVPASGRLAVP